jgi:hypothetical protein
MQQDAPGPEIKISMRKGEKETKTRKKKEKRDPK